MPVKEPKKRGRPRLPRDEHGNIIRNGVPDNNGQAIVKMTKDEVLVKARAASLAVRDKFTPERAEKAIEAARKGAPKTVMAHAAGVTIHALNNWLKRANEETEGPLADFALALYQAESEFELEALERVKAIGDAKGKWEAWMTILERRHPERWRRPSEAAQVQVNIGSFERNLKELSGNDNIIEAEVVSD